MTRTTQLRRMKSFVHDGALAAREVADATKILGIDPSGVIRVSFPSEGTDPSWYPQNTIAASRRMSQVYFRLYLFETALRRLVESVLTGTKGPGWFDVAVPESVKKEAERKRSEEGMARFHAARGPELLDYLSLTDLRKVIEANWDDFEPRLYQKEWALGKLEELRLTRNAMAHMGEVSDDDLARLDVVIRDWNIQAA